LFTTSIVQTLLEFNPQSQQAYQDFRLMAVTYRTADVEVREQFALPELHQREILRSAKALGIPGMMILATCNRTELFAFGAISI
jgi:glutamyl-tRNA reductase